MEFVCHKSSHLKSNDLSLINKQINLVLKIILFFFIKLKKKLDSNLKIKKKVKRVIVYHDD